MRNFIDIVEATSQPDLEAALESLRDYILHNEPADQFAIREALYAHGYSEPVQQTKFFRGVWHEASDGGTLADFLDHARDGKLFTFTDPQSCSTSLEYCLAFIGSTIFNTRPDPNAWIEHQPHTPLSDLHNGEAILIYEVEAPHSAILWSDAGLKEFAKTLPGNLRGVIDEAFDMWDGYGNHGEAMIDFTQARVIDTHLYDSAEDQDEYEYDS